MGLPCRGDERLLGKLVLVAWRFSPFAGVVGGLSALPRHLQNFDDLSRVVDLPWVRPYPAVVHRSFGDGLKLIFSDVDIL